VTTDVNSWRGVATEKADEVSAGLAALLRERSRRLLGDLLRPYRRGVINTISLIVVQSLAALAGPWLVGIAIDSGLPPLIRSRDVAPLLTIAAAFAVAVAVQAVTTRLFVTMTGRIGQQVVLELRRRLFAHFLSLEVAFHEDYTSGRVISRQTSDLEAISDLFEEGLDSLIAAVLTLLLVGTGMMLLDWKLGLVVLAGFIPLIWLTAWFRHESATSSPAWCSATAACSPSRATSRSGSWPPSCSTCSGSSIRCRTCRSSTTSSSRRPRAWRRSPASSSRTPGCPSRPTRRNCRRWIGRGGSGG
jgi:ATP-binding cassette subfamily B protein